MRNYLRTGRDADYDIVRTAVEGILMSRLGMTRADVMELTEPEVDRYLCYIAAVDRMTEDKMREARH
jgi:hypothetical protein